MPLAQKKPLSLEEKKMLIMVTAEMQSRGMKIPEIPQDALAAQTLRWPIDSSGYFIGRNGKSFVPNTAQKAFIDNRARFSLLYSGRGGGKTCSAAQKALKKVMQGQGGAIFNPDFENFRFSTWPEFKLWIPWDMVVPSQRVRESDAWQPTQPFVMVFKNGARVYCKGLKDPDSARGPNINWLWYDESGRDETGMSWKLAIASVRIGENPQAWCTQTAKPPSHWSYKFFIEKDIPQDAIDAFGLAGKTTDEFIQSFHTTTDENKANLDPGFYASLLATYHSGALRDRELNGLYVDDGGKIGDSSKIIKITSIPEHWELGRTVRYWDMAATEKKMKNDPDEFVGSKVQECFVKMDVDGRIKKVRKYVILDQVSGYFMWEQLLKVITETSLIDGPACTVIIEQEPASGGKNQVAAVQLHFKKNEEHPELAYWKVEPQRPTDRVQEAYVWFGYANAGNVYMIDNPAWNKGFFDQVDSFTFAGHDDKVTATSGAMRWLSPVFKIWRNIDFLSL